MNNSPIVSRVGFFYGRVRLVSVLRMSSSYENLIDVSDSNSFACVVNLSSARSLAFVLIARIAEDSS
jgi:hypothetical protein